MSEFPKDLDGLLQLLKNPNSNESSNAAAILGMHNDPGAIDPLIQALNNPDEDFRFQVTIALKKFGQSSLEKLLAVLQSQENTSFRSNVARALKSFGPNAVEPLLAVLKDENEPPELRTEIIALLEVLADSRAVEPLGFILQNDVSDALRETTAHVLGNLALFYSVEKPRAIELLLKALTDSSGDVREIAAEYMGHFEVQAAFELLVKLLNDPIGKVRNQAINSLRSLGNRESIKPVLPLLKDISPDIRSSVIMALVDFQAYETTNAIAELLEDREGDIKFWSGWALGMLGDERGYQPMIESLTSSSSWQVLRASESLYQLGNPAALSALMKVKFNPYNFPSAVIKAIIKFGTAIEIENYLEETYNSNGAVVRSEIVRILGNLRYRPALPLLKSWIPQEGPLNRVIVEAIEKIEANMEN